MIVPSTAIEAAPAALDRRLVMRLRAIALRGLPGMYRPRENQFGFCVRRGRGGDVLEGLSRRYTAITLLGLAGEPETLGRGILAGQSPAGLARRLLRAVARAENLGDVALTLWAAQALGIHDRSGAFARLSELGPSTRPHPTVELAWTLDALTRNADWSDAAALRDAVARRLLSAYEPATGLFRHTVGGGRALRGHVACFADIVYPVHALAHYAAATGDATALAAANRCAARACELQGAAGQWWWHYDTRGGRVVEGYPVYAVHQDAMAPLALFALAEAGGDDHSAAVQRGLDWLVRAPELNGGTLIDEPANAVWRKVARREPRKLVRRMQAAATAVHAGLRVPGVDTLFPPVEVDWECRPYHLGWILYAWSPARLTRWGWAEGAPDA